MRGACEITADALVRLRSHFGHERFRHGQERIVAAVLGGRDVLAVMPTGSGKSIGYQLPAMMLPGTTIVVSPLISLMKDQVDDLRRRGIAARALHSLLSPDDRREAWRAARGRSIRLLYVSPERFTSDEFLRVLAELDVTRFVVDEAHCVSQWGHDFRPDYRRLRSAAERCRRSDGGSGRPPVAAFTATATPEVRDDIVALLGLSEPQIVVSGFDRPNIHLRIRRVFDENMTDELLPALVRGRRALVYAATRKSTEAVSGVLRLAGITSDAYHAGMKDAERTRVQNAFASGQVPVSAPPTPSVWESIVRMSMRSCTMPYPGRSRPTIRRSDGRGGTDVRRPRRCSGIMPTSLRADSSSIARSATRAGAHTSPWIRPRMRVAESSSTRSSIA